MNINIHKVEGFLHVQCSLNGDNSIGVVCTDDSIPDYGITFRIFLTLRTSLYTDVNMNKLLTFEHGEFQIARTGVWRIWCLQKFLDNNFNRYPGSKRILSSMLFHLFFKCRVKSATLYTQLQCINFYLEKMWTLINNLLDVTCSFMFAQYLHIKVYTFHMRHEQISAPICNMVTAVIGASNRFLKYNRKWRYKNQKTTT